MSAPNEKLPPLAQGRPSAQTVPMEIIVACPQCDYHLHLPSREFLGRKGKCPRCSYKFVMEKALTPESPPENPPKPAPPPPRPGKSQKPAETHGKVQYEPAPVPEPPPADFQRLSETEPPRRNGKSAERAPRSDRQERMRNPNDSAVLPEDFFEDVEISNSPTEGSAAGARSSLHSSFELGGHAVRCPYCHARVPFQRVEDLLELNCPDCQTRFSLIPPETAAADIAMPPHVGPYALPQQSRAGVGPFGMVFRAKDGQTGKPIAIKVSWANPVDERKTEDFLTGLRSVMQLRHDNIVTLHEVDRAEDRIYIVSDYARGSVELSEYLAKSSERKLSFREIASLCAGIASGLNHAHKFDVVHGNLKPTNIRLRADLEPYLMDFSLNTGRSAQTLTAGGDIVGDAAYLAPEQLPEAGGVADPLTDVFAFGVILYELLTGRRPFRGKGRDLLKQIAKGRPPSPRAVNSSVPKPLDAICMKCLEVHPRDRYPSGMAIVSELRRYLQNQPIKTKPPGMLARLGRWCRRRPILFGMLLTFTLLGVACAGFIGWHLW